MINTPAIVNSLQLYHG